MKFYDPDKVAVEIVAFGPGIELLRPENPNRKLVESLVAQGARVDICLNTVDTLERDTGKRPEFISAATPVQVGVAQILLLTENGYTLVQALSIRKSHHRTVGRGTIDGIAGDQGPELRPAVM